MAEEEEKTSRLPVLLPAPDDPLLLLNRKIQRDRCSFCWLIPNGVLKQKIYKADRSVVSQNVLQPTRKSCAVSLDTVIGGYRNRCRFRSNSAQIWPFLKHLLLQRLTALARVA